MTNTVVECSNLDLPEVIEKEWEKDDVSEQVVQQEPKACEDSRFIRFFKMIQFGVPLAAVKQKMVTEGLDPGILE